MFMALLSPWSYFGREASPDDLDLWVVGPFEGDVHWPAFWPDSQIGGDDLWRVHTRNVGGA